MSVRVDQSARNIDRATIAPAQSTQSKRGFLPDAKVQPQPQPAPQRGPDLFSQSIKEAQDGDEGMHRQKLGQERGDGESTELPIKADLTVEAGARGRSGSGGNESQQDGSAEQTISEALKKRGAETEAVGALAGTTSIQSVGSVEEMHDQLMLDTAPMERAQIATFMSSGAAQKMEQLFTSALWQIDNTAQDSLLNQQMEHASA